MKFLLPLALLAVLPSGRVPTGDLVVTTSKKADATQYTPAVNSTEVQWIGTDRMRIEEGDSVTIVRLDLKKLYMVDTKAKTYSTLDLPVDMKKYIPAEYAGMMQQMMGQNKATVTPTTETKKIKDWNATRFTLTVSMPMGGSMKSEIWATKDVEFQVASYGSLCEAFVSSSMMAGPMASEMKKIDGLPVLTERTMNMMGSSSKSVEEVTSIEHKDPPAGHYDPPAGFVEKAFDPMADMEKKMGGGPGGRGPRRQ